MLGAPNYVYVDYARAAFTRTLGAGGRGADRFVAPAGDVSLRLGGYRAGASVLWGPASVAEAEAATLTLSSVAVLFALVAVVLRSTSGH